MSWKSVKVQLPRTTDRVGVPDADVADWAVERHLESHRADDHLLSALFWLTPADSHATTIPACLPEFAQIRGGRNGWSHG